MQAMTSKFSSRFLLLILCLPLFLHGPTAKSVDHLPFQVHGWQFHEYDLPKLEEAIRKAPAYGVNLFVFSHLLFRSVEGFLLSDDDFDPERVRAFPHLAKLYRSSHTKPHAGWQRDIRYLGSLADDVNIPYYLWIHEFDEIPEVYKVEGKVNYDHAGLFGYLEDRYERLLKAVPNTAGFVLTFHESRNKIFRNREVISRRPVHERIYLLTKLIYDVATRHNKRLILRNFLYEPLEREYFSQALARLPDDLIVMSKTTFHEFDPFYPPDAMHGNVGAKQQLIEIDLGVEKAWSHRGAYAQVEYIQRYARRARDKRLAGMVGRVRLLWDNPFDTSHELNLYALSQFMHNPDLAANEVTSAWAARRYPSKAVPHIVSALNRTQYINHHGRYHLGFWLTKSIGEQWDDYGYYFGHLMLRSLHKWTQDPADKAMETRLYYPDRETYDRLVAEKDEVLRQVQASLADLTTAAPCLSQAQYAPLQEEFLFLLDAARLARAWTRAYFAQRMYIRDHVASQRQMAEEALAELESLDKASGVSYGLDPATGHRYHIDVFVSKMRQRMRDTTSAKAEDDVILKKIRDKMDVTKN